MKYLRLFYMIVATILLSPLIVITLVGGLIYYLIGSYILKYKTIETINDNFILYAFKVWAHVICEGIKMNKDFIQNGI